MIMSVKVAIATLSFFRLLDTNDMETEYSPRLSALMDRMSESFANWKERRKRLVGLTEEQIAIELGWRPPPTSNLGT